VKGGSRVPIPLIPAVGGAGLAGWLWGKRRKGVIEQLQGLFTIILLLVIVIAVLKFTKKI